MAPKNQILLLAICPFLFLTLGDALVCFKSKTDLTSNEIGDESTCEVPLGPNACFTMHEFRGGQLSAIHQDCCYSCKPPITSTFCVRNEFPDKNLVIQIDCCDDRDNCNVKGNEK